MAHLLTYETHMLFSVGGATEHEPKLILRYWVSPGHAQTRDDPGSSASVELYTAHVKLDDGSEVALPEWMFGILYRDESLLAELLNDAAEADEYARDQAADARREEMIMERGQ